ncbi:MAG: single-stranded-DNA-specific exonuclease RecJ [Deltaproteobacteria bacterium]|nr:single-stranded-DNA-specific exonuclease RecJ [Deltaproteobacteria bacterium]
MKKRDANWKLSPVNKELQDTLGRELDILPVTAQLLINRGLDDCGKASSFLKPDLGNLHDPFLLKDMDRAVERIMEAMRSGEKMAVWGDYDVDGVTSAALLYLFFREIGVDVETYIPDRRSEGYGLNAAGVKALAGKGVKVIITVDCGVSDCEEVIFARSMGVDCIISDHHRIHGDMPSAYAVINPQRADCAFPFKGLAGVGVAFNLVVALRARMRDSGLLNGEVPNLKKYLDIVCIGTVADMVPLVDENRILVSWGLKELNSTKRPGLKALAQVAGIVPGGVTAEKIAFQLAPRINAAGRLERADTALRLISTDDEREAAGLARALDSGNSSRRGIEEKILIEAVEMIEAGKKERADRAIVLSGELWHPGVIGIVASRLVERYGRPVAVITLEGDMGKGSVRGVKGCDVMEGLNACSSFLERYGGHRAAAGLSIRKERVNGFMEAYIDFMNRAVLDASLAAEVAVDYVVSFEDITERLVSEIERLSPFGCSNEKPLLCATSTDILSTEVVGTRHLRMTLSQGGRTRDAIAFNMAGVHPLKGKGFDIAFYPYMDEWRGTRNLRLSVKELKTPANQPESAVNQPASPA